MGHRVGNYADRGPYSSSENRLTFELYKLVRAPSEIGGERDETGHRPLVQPEGDTSSAQPEEEKSAGSADTEAKDTADRKNVEPKREMEANPEGAEPVEEGVAGSKKGDVAPDNSVTAEAAAIKAEAEVQPQAQSPATGPSRSGGSGKNERSAGSPNDRSAEDEVRLIEKVTSPPPLAPPTSAAPLFTD